MAFQMDMFTNNGVVEKDAYVRIDTVSGHKGRIDISVNAYVSQDAFKSEHGYIKQSFYNFVPSVDETSDNFIRQGYEYLKTLPEYESAADILE